MDSLAMKLADGLKSLLLSIYYKLLQNLDGKLYVYWYKHSKDLENFGDIAGPAIITSLTGRKIYNFPADHPKHFKYIEHYLSVGSILSMSTHNSIIWGSGIISSNEKISGFKKIYAVRGPLTRRRIIQLGHNCPPVYGDPALILPILFPRSHNPSNSKKTIIPHYVDLEETNTMIGDTDAFIIVDLLTDNFEETLNQILSASLVISSSLHGIIIAAAYGIPFYWVKFSDKIYGDNVKYLDFFQSVGIDATTPVIINSYGDLEDLLKENAIKVDSKKITSLQLGLLEAFPLKINNKEILNFIDRAGKN